MEEKSGKWIYLAFILILSISWVQCIDEPRLPRSFASSFGGIFSNFLKQSSSFSKTIDGVESSSLPTGSSSDYSSSASIADNGEKIDESSDSDKLITNYEPAPMKSKNTIWGRKESYRFRRGVTEEIENQDMDYSDGDGTDVSDDGNIHDTEEDQNDKGSGGGDKLPMQNNGFKKFIAKLSGSFNKIFSKIFG